MFLFVCVCVLVCVCLLMYLCFCLCVKYSLQDGEGEPKNPYHRKLEFVYDPYFKNNVNYSSTAVQIPTDIYKGGMYKY